MKNAWTIFPNLWTMIPMPYYNSIFDNRNSGIPQSIRFRGKKKRNKK
jgi:hypothetical protein